MDFKNMPLRLIVPILLLGFLLIGLLIWKFSPPAPSTPPDEVALNMKAPPTDGVPLKAVTPQGTAPVDEQETGLIEQDDAAIQAQLDRDRQQQKQTKYLRMQLEQTNLELEQEKALAQINKLKMEDRGAFNEPTLDGQKNLPEIKVEYIGGDALKKEAILSIAGLSFQVKEKSNPTDNIQVVSISDSSVTLHFSAPQDLTKTIDYKPE